MMSGIGSTCSWSAAARLVWRRPLARRSAAVRVGMVDDNPSLGGQIWRGNSKNGTTMKEAAKWFNRRAANGRVTTLFHQLFHQSEPGNTLAEGAENLLELSYRKSHSGDGRAENGFFLFPGWTLPNVMGAGGSAELWLNRVFRFAGKRVVVAGSGPLLSGGCRLSCANMAPRFPSICEQASWRISRWLQYCSAAPA